MNAKNDPLVKAQRKAYRDSYVGKLDELLKAERRWKSKETLASNKLKQVRAQIALFAGCLAQVADRRGFGSGGEQ